jgi:hypothetical protein
MALGTIQPLTEMITRNVSWRVMAAEAYGRQTGNFYGPIVLKSWILNLLDPSRSVRSVLCLLMKLRQYYDCATLRFKTKNFYIICN